MRNIISLLFVLIMIIGLSGCGNNKNTMPQAIVDIKDIKTEQIIETLNSTGRINAKYDVSVVARVDGYLEKKYFNEGSMVKKGDLLFQIEPYTYSAKVNQAAANLRNAQASLRDSSKNLTRAAQLVKSDYISKADYDNKLAIRDQDRANVDSTKAALTEAQINLGYTKIHSPITGKIGKIYITEGNYVTPVSGTLATIVSLDPIQVDFTLKSKSYLTLKKASKVDDLSDISVEITLSDDTVYPEKGKIAFIDNTIDETAGTIQVRALFNNAKNLLIPGDYATVKIILDKPRDVILVPQEAVLQTETGKYLYVIDENNKAFKRDIVAEEDYKGNWIVTEGLSDGERVATTGLQFIQEGQPVTINQQAKAEKNAKKEIKGVGKPSFAQKISHKIKRAIKKIMGK
ncbi:MAG: efflux RND transporter periplasmic adaptor subunit [Candidatus Gastranaerophilales bacterium]|nr:efflux RND transporter periplasmic adaptor subunit [Candidatus Gastranaerophilales bacterium]